MRSVTMGNLPHRSYRLASVIRSAKGLRRSLALLVGVLGISLLGACSTTRARTDGVGGMPAAALLPPEPAVPGPDYRIRAGDELHVRFLHQPENNEQLPVRPDGRITLGVTGQIDAVGLTPTELEQVIVEKSSHRLRDPEVSVVVTKVGEQRVFVGGEVARPGVVLLQSGMTPLQAVMQSGGFRPTAKPDSVVLITPGQDGKFSASRINLEQVLQDGVPERVRLRPDEIVFVPKSWVGNMNEVVDLYVRGLIPALPRVGVGYSLSGNN